MKRSILLFISKLLFSVLAKSWKLERIALLQKPCIIAFWHGGMLPCWYVCTSFNPVGVVSKSKDGEILSNVLEGWGYRLVRGSSSSGGSEVLKEMTSLAKEGNTIVITPDGPRGPNEVFKVGAVIASQRAQVPIVLIKPKVTKAYIFEKSWDNFSVPFPFSTIRFSTKTIEAISPSALPSDIEKIAQECGNWLSEPFQEN